MTMKKLSLSALAASLLATVAIAAPAGSLVVDTNASIIASELLVDNNYTIGSTDVNATYKPVLNAGVQDGKLLVTLNGGTINSVPTAVMYNHDTNETVGINPQLAGADNQKLIFDINGTINDNDTLWLDGNGSNKVQDSTDLDLKMTASKMQMKVDLLDNVDVIKSTSNQDEVATSSTEWGVKVGTPIFDAKIDAANSFKQFTDGTTPYSSDVANITVSNATVDVNTTNLDLNVTLLVDANISTYMDSIKFAGASMTADGMVGAKYAYKANKTVSAAGDYNITLDSNGSTELKKTNFTVKVSSDKAGANSNFTKEYLPQTTPFGEWTIYGYNAQVPNVRTKADHFATYINVTNTSSIAADATFVIYPKTTNAADNVKGTTCLYNAGSVASNSQRKFVFADILANSDCSDAVKSGVNFSLEFSVATEPNKVFANAYTKNIAVGGQFVVLPVYNTSDVNQ